MPCGPSSLDARTTRSTPRTQGHVGREHGHGSTPPGFADIVRIVFCGARRVIGTTTPNRRRQTTHMRAMVLERVGGPLRMVQRAAPEPEPGQLLVRVLACGVCRTDLHLLDGEVDI